MALGASLGEWAIPRDVHVVAVAALVRSYAYWIVSAVLLAAIARPVSRWLRICAVLNKVPGPNGTFPPLFIIRTYLPRAFTISGNDATHECSNVLRSLVDKYSPLGKGPGIIRIYLGFRPVVFLTSPETSEIIFTDQVNLKKAVTYFFMEKWLGVNLLLCHDEQWRIRRRLTTTALNAKVLDSFVSIYNEHAATFVGHLQGFVDKAPTDEIRLFREVSKCTLNIIGESALGCNLDAMSGENRYGKHLARLQFLLVTRIIRPWLWWDFFYEKFTHEGKMSNLCIRELHDVTNQVLEQCKRRRANGVEATSPEKQIGNGDADDNIAHKTRFRVKTFMEYLYDFHLEQPETFTEQQVRNEVNGALFAGQDTIAASCAFALYLLGLYPDIQEKCRQEIFDVVGHDDPMEPLTNEHLKELKYTNACLLESMRLLPPVPLIGREPVTDVHIKGEDGVLYRIPPGTQIFASIFHLHRDPRYYPDPDSFKPERFLEPDPPHRQHQFAYVPFSSGPKNCLGQRFALAEAKVIMAFVLRNFNLASSTPLDKLRLCFEIVIRARGDLRIRLTPRHAKTPTSSP